MKSVFIFIFCACAWGSLAQDVTVSSTDEYTNQLQNAYWTRTLGQDESGYYLLREYGSVSNTKIVLEKYSTSLKMLYAMDIEATSGSFNDSKLHRYTEMKNGKVYVFLEGWSKANQQNSFIVKEVNNDGSLNSSEVVLETEPSTGQMKSANYSISFSPDGSKLLVLTQKPFVKGAKETVRLQVFNVSDFSSLWKQDLTLENEAERFPMNDIIVNNNGVAYIVKDIKISLKEHIYQVLTVDKSNSKVLKLDLSTYALGQKKMAIDPSGKLAIGATIVPLGRGDSDCQGTWFYRGDENGEMIQNRVEAFGREILSKVVPPKIAEKEGYILENTVLKDVLLKSDGGVLFLLEEQRRSKTAVGQTSPPTYQHEHFYGNVLVISTDATGQRIWSTVIEKQQGEKTMDPKIGFGSFAYQLKNDNLYIVWNFMAILSDPPLNKFRYWIDRSGSKINIDNLFGKEAFFPTMLTVIDKTGNFEYRDRTFNSLPLENIQKPNAFSMATDPAIFFATEKGMIILSHMPGIEAKRYKFNTITF